MDHIFLTVLAVVGTPLWLLLKSGVKREAVKTIIYLTEIRQGRKRIGFTPEFTDEGLLKSA